MHKTDDSPNFLTRTLAFIASTPVLQTLSNIITLPATRLIISGLVSDRLYPVPPGIVTPT